MINLTIENLSDGNIRATGRVSGATAARYDGTKSQAKELCLRILNEVAFAHKIGANFDLTFIEMNDAATKAVGLSQDAKQRITEKIKQALSNGN